MVENKNQIENFQIENSQMENYKKKMFRTSFSESKLH